MTEVYKYISAIEFIQKNSKSQTVQESLIVGIDIMLMSQLEGLDGAYHLIQGTYLRDDIRDNNYVITDDHIKELRMLKFLLG